MLVLYFLALCCCLHSTLANLKRKRKISGKMQFVMWFAGLRGAIAFALSMNMPNEDGRWDNNALESSTLAIVIFTTVVCGGLTGAWTPMHCGCMKCYSAT